MDDAQVRATLTGAANLAPPSSKRPKRVPFTVPLIELILNNLDHSDPLDAAVAACLTTTFHTAACTGEFTVSALNKFDPTIHIKRSDIRNGEDRHGMKVTVFAIPRTKCSPNGEDVYWAVQQGLSDPDSALKNHFRINDPLPHCHLFSYRHPKGSRPLTRRVFLDRLNAVAGLPQGQDLKGHGIRIGATLEYLLRGIPFDVVKSIGRWSSEAFLLYLRQHAVIMAPYMQGHPILDAFTRYTMPPVHHR
jgi:hypothetical protein